MLNFISIEKSNDNIVKEGERYLSPKEEKHCFLQNINENLQRNILLYNVLSNDNFHTIIGNLSSHDISLEILIYDETLWANKKLAEKILKINFPFYIISEVDILYENEKNNTLIIHTTNKTNKTTNKTNENRIPTYFVSIPLVIENGSISVNNENESVTLQLQCKPYVSQKITKKDKLFGLTRDGFKWAKHMEGVMFKES